MRQAVTVRDRKRQCGMGPALLAALALAAAAPVHAAPDERFEEVTVTATRIPVPWDRAPLAIGQVSRDQIQSGRQQLTLDESLVVVPGLFMQNRYNFAQELRIAIRGFGARANFGIRGIRMFADDIPLTMPDGQGNVDSIDLGSVERIEVIRGPVSAMYGAAGGGAILLYTERGPEVPFVSGRASTGAYGFNSAQLKAGGQALDGDLNWIGSLTGTEIDGYRDQSRFERTLLNARLGYVFGDDSELTVVVHAVDAPQTDDPGALTAAEVAANPRQAAPRNLLFDAGEALEQQRIGITWNKPLDGGQAVLLRGYLIRRDFQNLLAFDINANGQGGSVDLDRDVHGIGGHWSLDYALGGGRRMRLVAGFGFDEQLDLRRRYVNQFGVPGALTTNQDEDLSAGGIFTEAAFDLTRALVLRLGARFDDLDYSVTDRTGAGGSGETSFSEFSPMAGLLWSRDPAFGVYANFSTGFDAPSFTELANPTGATGFNESLGPQNASSYEVGFKGLVADLLRYEFAVYHIDVEDEIVPFELSGSGQAFFHNAGESTHEGAEAGVQAEILPGLTANATYSWSDFRFDEFGSAGGAGFADNHIPGIPEHQFHVGLDWRHERGLYAGIELLHVGKFYADNANAVETGDYTVSSLRAGYHWSGARWEIEPFVGVNNLGDEDYSANVRINAAFARYYEPAPGRNVYGGVELRANF